METEELDPTQYLENRLAFLDGLKKSGVNPFLLEFKLSMNLERFRGEFGSVEKGQRFETRVSVAGRVMSKRSGGPKLVFYSLESAEGKLQAVADARLAEGDFQAIHSGIKRGDVVGVTGFPGKTKRGEISIFASNFFLLAPCLEMLPKGGKTRDEQESWRPGVARNPNAYALRNQETRYRCRYLDMIVNPEVRHVFGARDGVVDCIRKFLHSGGFSEVETSYLNGKAGGATAKPFITHHKQSKLHLRISPELQLKPLLVSGYEGVCEFGKQFRNEGMDLTHNPEFTTCEFYKAYADYEDLMVMTEKLISELVMEITGGYKVSYHSNGYDNPPVVIDFTPPFRRIEMVKGLEEAMGVELPKDLASDEANEFLRATCDGRGVFCAPPLTTARLLDKLVGHYLEETCVNPTFIIDHPLIMSPLAKRHRSKVGLTERFELFVNKHELVNAYTELNIPGDQRERFAEQLKDKLVGDSEAMETDEEFITALEYGLPPCAGWGIGVDRLAMLLTDSLSIKEVLLFPTMKPDIIGKGSEGTPAT